MSVRIDAYLRESPMLAVKAAVKRFDALAEEAFAADGLGFTEGLVLAATFLEESQQSRPSQLADAFGTTRGNVSHAVSSLEAKGLIQRKIDPVDARGYILTLKPAGKRCAVRVVGAFDAMQRDFEKQVGRANLANALNVLRSLQEM